MSTRILNSAKHEPANWPDLFCGALTKSPDFRSLSGLTRQYQAAAKSTLAANYLYLAQHRLAMSWHKTLPSAASQWPTCWFPWGCPMLGHANVLSRARKMCCLQGQSWFFFLCVCYFNIRSNKHTHTYVNRSLKNDINSTGAELVAGSTRAHMLCRLSWTHSSKASSLLQTLTSFLFSR